MCSEQWAMCKKSFHYDDDDDDAEEKEVEKEEQEREEEETTNLNRDRAALSLEMVRVFAWRSRTTRRWGDVNEAVRVVKRMCCEHGRLAEGIDHRSDPLLFRHWIHTMTCCRSLDFIRWHALAWGQHNDGVILNNKSGKLLYISKKNSQNYQKQSNLTTILTNHEAKRYKRAQLKYSVDESLSFFENHPFLREAASNSRALELFLFRWNYRSVECVANMVGWPRVSIDHI